MILKLSDIQPEEICFDCDGVLYPFLKPFIEYFNSATGSKFDPKTFNDYGLTSLGIPRSEVLRHIGLFHRTPESKILRPYASSFQIIDYLDLIGVNPHIIASREEDLREITLESFRRDFRGKIPEKNIHFSNYQKNKVQFMKELGLKLIVEDYYGNAMDAINSGYLAIIVNHNYNLDDMKKHKEEQDKTNGNKELPEIKGLVELVDKIPAIQQRIQLVYASH